MGAASITGNQKFKASPAWNWLNQKQFQQIRTKTTAYILFLLCTILQQRSLATANTTQLIEEATVSGFSSRSKNFESQ